MVAKRYLVPRQLEAAGLSAKEVKFPLSTIDSVIENYTLEAGVRELDRVLGTLCRRIVRRRMSAGTLETESPLKVDKRLAGELLGAKKVCWTSHNPEDKTENDSVIFEFYNPPTTW